MAVYQPPGCWPNPVLGARCGRLKYQKRTRLAQKKQQFREKPRHSAKLRCIAFPVLKMRWVKPLLLLCCLLRIGCKAEREESCNNAAVPDSSEKKE
jgi:hypothetical protein